MAQILQAKYEVVELQPKADDIPLPIAIANNFGDAMAKAEEYCEQWEEQRFLGVWLGENLVAIFDSNDWFTK